ncbi:MAG: hypothetical protein IKQ25_12055 [Lachnospiraceae bacterium]|nr:hypothetical protein [Lachnospiraceae bacterium]
MNEMISLAKGIQETAVLRFVLAGIIVFADKIIDIETGEEVAKRIMMTKVDMIFQERTDRAVAAALEKAAVENKAAMEQVMVEVRKEKAKVKAEKEKAQVEKEKAKVEKEQAIFAYIRDMQEGGAAKGTVLEKLMLIFRLSKKNAERYYEKA